METEKSRVVPDSTDIKNVRSLISVYAHNTPVMTNTTLDNLTGSRLFFKCENFQKGGAFKFRGASNAVFSLTKTDAQMGVCTHSSGNHAQALALAAKIRGIDAHIVMPENSPKVKIEAVMEYGGKITFCMPTLQDRETTLERVKAETGAMEIHPYNDYRIIAGQASVCAELLEKIDKLDYVICPVGGGGLLSGTILAAKYFAPDVKVIGAEPLQANDAWQSFVKNELVPSINPNTIADGLRTSLGSLTFPIIMEGVHDIITASEETIVQAMILVWERMKIVVEPSAVLPLAVVLENIDRFRGKRIGIILSGGNVDLASLPWNDCISFNKR
jgi:threonine dehydratase